MTKRVVLMYHDVYADDTSESGFQNVGAMPYKVNRKEFEQQVALIHDYCQEKGIDKSNISFTFDDGGRSFLYIVAEVLERYGFWGTFFIATAYIDTAGFLTKDEVLELKKRGHLIGTHSHTHPERMDTLQGTKLQEEWAVSCSILSEILDAPMSIASIPNGFSSKAVLQAMIDNGITLIYDSTPTTKKRSYKGVTIVGRYAITNDMSPASVLSIIKSPYKRASITLRYDILKFAKIVLGDSYLRIRDRLLKKSNR